jgi:hypothetical protein
MQARALDRSTIPHSLKNLLFDFIVFDDTISYEVTPGSRVDDDIHPTVTKIHLALQSHRVTERMHWFEDLWASAKVFD